MQSRKQFVGSFLSRLDSGREGTRTDRLLGKVYGVRPIAPVNPGSLHHSASERALPSISRIAADSFKVIGLLIGTVLIVAIGGCSTSGGGSGVFTISGTTSIATGDWDDVNAAVQAASQHREMAVLNESQPDPTTVEFNLVTVSSEPVTITVTRSNPPDPSIRLSQEGPIAMTIDVKVGRFGDSKRERELIDDIRFRLGDLIGPFTTKPLPSSWGGWGN